jgi:hypothetical protein
MIATDQRPSGALDPPGGIARSGLISIALRSEQINDE